MTDPAPTEQIVARGVTPEYFDALGAAALHGRALIAEDAKNSTGMPAAVLSNGFWQRRFASDPQAVGRTLMLQGQRFVVVGVMPPGFNGLSVDWAPDVRIPLRAYSLLAPEFRDDFFELTGRLSPGYTREQAEAECVAIWNSMAESEPGGAYAILNAAVRLDPMERGVSVVRDRFGNVLQLLIATVSALLLIACANLAGLQLARGTARKQELSVRRGIGATRGRLVRQMLAESLLLVVLGTAGGLWIAFVTTPPAMRMLPPMRDFSSALVPLSLDVGMDWRVFAFGVAISGLTLALFGLAPAVSISRGTLETMLRGVRARSSWRGQQALTVVQIALCAVLLTCAGLMVRTFRELRSVDSGFDAGQIATFTLDTWSGGYRRETEAVFLRTLTERVRQIPSVVSVGISSRGVMRGRGVGMTTAPVGQRTTRADFLNTDLHTVSPEYFETMGMRLLSGRTLSPTDVVLNGDTVARPWKVLVNQAFVRRFFPDVNPLGRHFGAGLETIVSVAGYEIIGVVSDAKYRSLRQPILPTVYSGPIEGTYGSVVLNVRSEAPPETIFQPVQKALAAIDPNMAFTEVHTLAGEVDDSTASERLAAGLGSIFGVLALLLAGVGLYGLLAYIVAQRRSEIGIRMAVGAQRGAVLRAVARDGMRLVLIGVSAGMAASLALTRLLSSLLYGVEPTDPLTFVSVAVLLLGVALVACYIPARRAAKVEPMVALRHE
jgi:predicted permease